MNKDEIRKMTQTITNYVSKKTGGQGFLLVLGNILNDELELDTHNYGIAEALYDAGCRIVADDEQVAKTDQLYETLNSTLESGKRMGYAQGRDETARKIFEDIEFYSVRSLNDEMWGNHFKLTDCTMLDLKMKYGIDKEIVYKYRID